MIRACRVLSTRVAASEIACSIEELSRREYRVNDAAILLGSGRVVPDLFLPDLELILRSHALIPTAEGEFYREALASASESCSLQVSKFIEREVWDIAAQLFHLDPPHCKIVSTNSAGSSGRRGRRTKS